MVSRKQSPTRKASGANIEEWQRHGVKVQFRLSQTESDALIARARSEELTPNAYVARLVRQALAVV
jgi:hypothetical protein